MSVKKLTKFEQECLIEMLQKELEEFKKVARGLLENAQYLNPHMSDRMLVDEIKLRKLREILEGR